MSLDKLTKLPEGWERILAEEYQAGASDVEVRARLRMTKGLWDSLMADVGQFREVVEFGRMLAKAWWLTQARKNLSERAFNANLWFMVMKNQYGYSEKTTTITKEAEELSGEELDERIQQVISKFNKVSK